MKRLQVLICACLAVFLQVAAQSLDVPELRHRITDLTATLSQNETESLEAKLEQFEHSSSNQIVVLIVPSLQGESIEDFTLRVGEKNKIGRKGKNNGVILLIAKDDRKMRIEVGYGLEGALTDALSSQIIRRVIAPRFRDGQYFDGISEGVDAIIAATKGEFSGESNTSKRGIPIPLIFVLFFVVTGFIEFLVRRRHYISRRGYIGGGPWFWGGGGFGGGGGFSGGGSGFSGGGGSFGGGGASGSW